ncbi:chorismate mutase [Paenibacillus melissococcoides]|uniref:chorismate mutase n=1 Tax=Paenibacillus melissococcoides TaxID=2912268 RepID=A0ABN8U3L1_9BACL|nr:MULTISPECIES: chorismate mutase [Paenibacillus]MEB9893333.1 chorismate mutase [Bacillus cereus]CAH8245662.1 chorismate mutase [Paenibacillus melissococcoides]CAH8711612.1 chorismate mutase [Paenibacillus melissococcoides]CAH8712377.1 chorismate mutase [Paenibacillus melissococcoides]GIO76997.1 chorismate mutase AroH [Paenibacillus dendritiformis]
MHARGIRGATTVQRNDADEIRRETTVLLEHIVAENQIVPEDIVSIWITMTQDLNASFPAQAIRAMPGWEWVPLMCAVEVPVAGSLPLCIRLMVTVNTNKSQREMRHVYLNDASQLRPDLATS